MEVESAKIPTPEEVAARKKREFDFNIGEAADWAVEQINEDAIRRLRKHMKAIGMTPGRMDRLGMAYLDAIKAACDKVDEEHVHVDHSSDESEESEESESEEDE